MNEQQSCDFSLVQAPRRPDEKRLHGVVLRKPRVSDPVRFRLHPGFPDLADDAEQKAVLVANRLQPGVFLQMIQNVGVENLIDDDALSAAQQAGSANR